MAKETERRFLVRSDEWRAQTGAGVRYLQGYLSTDSKRNVRIRIASNNEATLTIKGKTMGVKRGITRPEFEYPIPTKDAEELKELCLEPILEKTRYKLKQDGLTWEIDEYGADNEGLIVAEVETKSEGPIRKTPSWIGPEISGDRRYSNISLVEHPFRTWNQDQQKPDTKYYLRRGEKLPDGVRRILNEQVNAAIDELSNQRRPLEESVHEARKCVKKMRSLLRLVRQVIESAYDRENRQLQSVGRKLSEVRDAAALIETLHDLDKRQSTAKPAKNLTGLHLKSDLSDAYQFLRERKDKIAGEMQANGDISSVVEELEQARTRIDRLPLKKVEFSIVVDSLKTTMKRGERAFSNAYADPRPENFHECRKRVKDLRYQLGLLTKMWPGVLKGYADSAKDLEQVLGSDHNFAVLADVLRQKTGSSGHSSTLFPCIDKAQRELRDKAKQLSQRLYSEPIKAWTHRLESSWQTWDHRGN